MGDFLSNYGASILATITVLGGSGLLFAFRDALVSGFWNASEDRVQRILSNALTEVSESGNDETKPEREIANDAVRYKVSTVKGGGSEVHFSFPFCKVEIKLRLLEVGGTFLRLQDVSSSDTQMVYPYVEAGNVTGKDKTFWLMTNRDRSERGKLISFCESTSSHKVCTLLVHAENANPQDGEVTIVIESFAGRVVYPYEGGLGL